MNRKCFWCKISVFQVDIRYAMWFATKYTQWNYRIPKISQFIFMSYWETYTNCDFSEDHWKFDLSDMKNLSESNFCSVFSRFWNLSIVIMKNYPYNSKFCSMLLSLALYLLYIMYMCIYYDMRYFHDFVKFRTNYWGFRGKIIEIDVIFEASQKVVKIPKYL